MPCRARACPACNPVARLDPAYSPLGLRLYDPLIVRRLAPHVWRCSRVASSTTIDRHVTANHADIGVATGYFLDRCDFEHAASAAGADRSAAALPAIRRAAPCALSARDYLRDVLTPDRWASRRPRSIRSRSAASCIASPATCAQEPACSTPSRRSPRPARRSSATRCVRDGVAAPRAPRLVHALLNRAGVVDNPNDHAARSAPALEARFADCRSNYRVHGAVQRRGTVLTTNPSEDLMSRKSYVVLRAGVCLRGGSRLGKSVLLRAHHHGSRRGFCAPSCPCRCGPRARIAKWATSRAAMYSDGGYLTKQIRTSSRAIASTST